MNYEYPNFLTLLNSRPNAMAKISGSRTYPEITGNVFFYQTDYGVMVIAEIIGLPNPDRDCASPVFGFHIHEGSTCSGNSTDEFADVRTHYNPQDCPHPFHAGDLPPLFGSGGIAFTMFLTNRFTVNEIIDKTVIIHSAPDDFTTQPSGNSGIKIACGEINSVIPPFFQ